MIRFVSTRAGSPPEDFVGAVGAGLAPDGGLYVPERLPKIRQGAQEDFVATAVRVIAPFVAGTPLETELEGICERAFDFPLVLEERFLELFHGPTAAFKDFGARFLAECMAVAGGGPRTVLVATSGDTGGAVAAAFASRPGFRVVVLFPKDGVSEFQRHQLTCWGDSVDAVAVRGTFDDCQRLVKKAFGDRGLRERAGLTSANSINIGRLLPQAAYYAWASGQMIARNGRGSGFVVPTGNLGNALAAVWAREMGFPVSRVFLATNDNRTLSDYFGSGDWRPRPSVRTLANAMDVGDPSNGERLRHLYPSIDALREFCDCASFEDARIREAIRRTWRGSRRAICPHTATGVLALESLRAKGDSGDWVIVSTAHAAKFKETVDPLLALEGAGPLEYPPNLRRILSAPSRWSEIAADFDALAARIIARLAPGADR